MIYAARCGERSCQGGQDTDDDLDDELPDVFLGVVTGDGDRLHLRHFRGYIRVRNDVVDRLVDGFFEELAKKLANELLHT